MTKKRRVIAIDFDGTICTNKYPFIGDPNPDIINRAIFEQKRLGACLVLWTCRTGQLLDDAILACAMWGLEFDYVNETPPFASRSITATTRARFRRMNTGTIAPLP